MSGPWARSDVGTRLLLLRVLAQTDGPLTSKALGVKVGLSAKWVRDALARPIRCGWVGSAQPVQVGYRPNPAKEYWITEKGREHLASLVED